MLSICVCVHVRVCGAYKAPANKISKSCGTRHFVIRRALSTGYCLRDPLHFMASPNTDSVSLAISCWCRVGAVDNMYTILHQ